MNEYCVVTVDGTRARFFCLEKPEMPAVESGPYLVEQSEALISTEIDMPGRELWTDAKSGRRPGAGHMAAHGIDDHRDQHTEEFRRRFAKQIAEETLKLAQRCKPKALVLVAEKQMLGFLRGALQVPVKAGFVVKEVAKDLSRLSPLELQSHLAAEGVLPQRHKSAMLEQPYK